MTGLLAAADLDGTLVFSGRALGGPPGTNHHAVEVVDGRPSAWVPAAAVTDLSVLAESGALLPVTTRSLDQFRRLALPGPPVPWAVVANGGQLLERGEADPAWDARVRGVIAAEAPPTGDVLAHLAPWAGQGWLRTFREVDGLFCYAVATSRDALPPGEVAELADWARPRGLEVSVQGRKVYVVPRSLTKQAAVLEVIGRTGAPGFVAAGDSLLDAGLLDAAAAGIRPSHGELHHTGWHRAHVEITERSGSAAGVEIAAWLLLQVREGGAPTEHAVRAVRAAGARSG